MNCYFVLQDKQPVPEPDMHEWSLWFETADRVVKQEMVDVFFVSTVFLGIEHGLNEEGLPFLFETMTFLNGEDVSVIRAVDWDGALANHLQEVEARKLLAQ